MFQVDVLVNLLTRCGCQTMAKKVSSANLFRWNTNNLRDPIHVTFNSKQALRRTKLAKSTVWWRIRCKSLRTHADVRPIVGSSRMNCAPRKHCGRQGRVRAAIERKIYLCSEQLSVFRNRSANT